MVCVWEGGVYNPGSWRGLLGFRRRTIVPSCHWSGNLPSDQDLLTNVIIAIYTGQMNVSACHNGS